MSRSEYSSVGSRSAPIFIIGSGRSGTSLLYRLMAGHPDLAWVSLVTDKWPFASQLSALSSLPVVSRHRYLQPSKESINVYRHCGIRGAVAAKGGVLQSGDVDQSAINRLREIVHQHQKWMRRPRFLNKNTNNSMRVRVLKEAFPNAYFIHIIRNGYAVCNSLSNVHWWPDLRLWWLGKTPRQWVDEGGDPYEICAMHWSQQVRSIFTQVEEIDHERYIECRYEELLKRPEETIQRLCQACDLKWSTPIHEHVQRAAIRADNVDKWKKHLDATARASIAGAADELLAELGYASSN